MKSINFDWTKETEFSLDGESEILEIDSLDRQKYAEYLYFYLKEQGNKNTVINLNAEWGSGKTYFIKRLYSSLNKHHPCIYIDAWKQDFSDDAFLTLFSSLINQIEFYSGNLDRKLIRASESIGRFTKGIVPEVISGLLKKYAGLEDISDIAKTASTLMLEQHNEKLKAIAKLKKELSFWADLSFKKGYNSPVFIFIDELDRCRPDYSISLLEIVKHIFSVDKFIFIIATDTNQLQHSIKNVYGNEFDANLYLSRFFHRRFSLHAPDLEKITLENIKERLTEHFDKIKINSYPKPTNIERFSYNCSSILKAFNLNIRDSKKNLDRLLDILILSKINKKIDYTMLFILMIIHDIDIDLFNLITDRSLRKNPIPDMILENKNLREVNHSNFFIYIDNSYENTGLNRLYLAAHLDQCISVNIEEKKIEIPCRDYINLVISFTKKAEKIKSEIKSGSPNSLLRISRFDSISVDEIVQIQQGSLFKLNEEVKIYNIKDYINFIELSVSFN
ncbi:KAP family P-loop NTPase fold protein [Pectobacterium brasiliense]|uniref:KAP family P-loop NTPase fold protein n=1 Tax=Pectobacterium brasiliense TaxID=180957 RepID=UPI002A814F67|nr:P-loop NTPase fold protein [Pectobacterium brasiliense]MDY4383885.1 P-loop NTPase fold protein [Pectobacterium brasiliense]